MNTNEYLKSDDKYELMLLMAAAYNIRKYANDTKEHAKNDTEKSWAKDLSTAATKINKCVKERLSQLNEGQYKDMDIRMKGCLLKVVPYDQVKIQRAMRGRDTHVCIEEDLMMCLELALIGCHNCPQGEYVNKCPYRKALHSCGVPISQREAEGPGRCEFRSEDGIQIILPQGNDKQAKLLQEKLSAVFTMDGKRKDMKAPHLIQGYF